MANLYNSAKEGVDTTDVLSFPTGYEPKQESVNTNFKQLKRKKSNEPFKTSMAAKVEFREAHQRGLTEMKS